jgi:hypothetical protein
MEDTSMMDYETARRLVERGWATIPTNSNSEKRPLGRFSTANSWRDFSERLPTDEELHEFFDAPRRGGVVLHRGQLVVDYDTKDTPPDPSLAPLEETVHGYHQFWRCAPDAKIAHDRDAKIDYLTCGSFVRLTNPRCLLDWRGELPELGGESGMGLGGKSGISGISGESGQPGSIWSTLEAAGWKAGQERNGWIEIRNGTKTAAISANGENIKVFSTSIWEAPSAEAPAEPIIAPAAEVVANSPSLSEAILPFCRRGSFALLSGDPKAGKSTFALRAAIKAASQRRRVVYADLENGARLFAHRVRKWCGGEELPQGLYYLDCTEHPNIDYIAAGVSAVGGKIDLLFIDPWGLLISGDGVEDESSNALVSAYFLRVRRILKPFDCATVILHHQPKSGANEKLCFAGAGASALPRYVQSICRIRDKDGAFWFEALCREFDEPFKPFLIRRESAL